MKIGFIGLGNMGGAIAKAIARHKKHQLMYSNHNLDKAQKFTNLFPGKICSNKEIASEADVVFLGVKPHLLASLLIDLRSDASFSNKTIWVSMAAGVSLAQLEEWLPESPLVRMMPNTPVAIGQGMTTFACNQAELVPFFEELMVHSGQVMPLAETQIDAATAIAGCGPAFVFEFIQSMISAGLENGLSTALAQELATQTVLGAASLLQVSKEHPAILRDQVTSPGGATIAGLSAMTSAGFQAATLAGIHKALERTKELGQK